MRILIVDTETTGTDHSKDSVVEVAAMLYDTKHASPIESFACLIKHTENGAEKFNGIPAALLMEQGLEPESVWGRFCDLSADADCFVAHSAEFDRGFVFKEVGAISAIVSFEDWAPEKPWVCTMQDLQWPGARESRSLMSLALSLGLGVSHAHRAAVDVETIARCLTRAQELMRSSWLKAQIWPDGSGPLPEHGDFLEPMIRRGMRPKVRVVAKVSYDDRQLCKDANFSWDGDKRQWWKMLPAEDAAALPFRTVVIT